MKNYTKGTWTLAADKAIGEKRTDMIVYTSGRHTLNIARVINCLGMTEQEFKDNAELIKSAPAMYEALQYIRLKLRDLSEDEFSSDWTTDVLNEIRKFDSQDHPAPIDHNQEQFEK